MATNEQLTSSGRSADIPAESNIQHIDPHPETHHDSATGPTFINSALHTSSESYYGGRGSGLFTASSHSTAVPSPDAVDNRIPELEDDVVPESEAQREEEVVPYVHSDSSSDSEDEEPAEVKPTSSATRPSLQSKQSRPMTEDDLFRVLSRRRTSQTNALSRKDTQATASSADDEQDEINKLMSRMFGHTRQEASEEEKTRHLGVIFKNLTVKGQGLGAALQPTAGDFFMNPVRLLKNLFTRGPKAAAGKPPVRTLIDDFSGCIKPGEMLLVLGRPGSGCSTFLKMLGNQRFGYEEITGDVRYGGTDADEMAKKYRSEVLYNPEDDLHYATLKVKDTLKFALKTRTPGKDSRKDGESRADYVSEFLRVVTKLFWIEHTLGTKVGNEFVRGVSGGEKKRVSIAEAMITKASVQSWVSNIYEPFL